MAFTFSLGNMPMLELIDKHIVPDIMGDAVSPYVGCKLHLGAGGVFRTPSMIRFNPFALPMFGRGSREVAHVRGSLAYAITVF